MAKFTSSCFSGGEFDVDSEKIGKWASPAAFTKYGHVLKPYKVIDHCSSSDQFLSKFYLKTNTIEMISKN